MVDNLHHPSLPPHTQTPSCSVFLDQLQQDGSPSGDTTVFWDVPPKANYTASQTETVQADRNAPHYSLPHTVFSKSILSLRHFRSSVSWGFTQRWLVLTDVSEHDHTVQEENYSSPMKIGSIGCPGTSVSFSYQPTLP